MKKSYFIKLPLLDFLIDQYQDKNQDLSGVAIISVQHLLETTGSMFESILDIGIPKDQIFITGKLYSNDPRTMSKLKKVGLSHTKSSDSIVLGKYYELLRQDCINLWKVTLEAIKNKDVHTIIVLDDGGMLLKTIPNFASEHYNLIGIEQTSSGVKLNSAPKIPVINVARSLVKTSVEPAFISQAVIQKTRMKLLKLRPKKVGIIGFGTIGKGLYHDLKNNFDLLLYDTNDSFEFEDKLIYQKHYTTLKELYLESDVIIGATGTDVSFVPIIDDLKSDKLLMSVSSGDIEFKSLLETCQVQRNLEVTSILEDIEVSNDAGYKLTILRGGTPVNFDNNIHSVLPEYIQLTRGLLLLAVMQAIKIVSKKNQDKGYIELDMKGQKILLEKFISLKEVDLKNFEFSPPLLELLQYTEAYI